MFFIYTNCLLHLKMIVLYTNIYQTLVNSLHGLLNCETGGLDCRVITTECRTRVHFIHMYHLFLQCVGPCNLFVSVWSMFVYNSSIVCGFCLTLKASFKWLYVYDSYGSS